MNSDVLPGTAKKRSRLSGNGKKERNRQKRQRKKRADEEAQLAGWRDVDANTGVFMMVPVHPNRHYTALRMRAILMHI